MSNNIRYLIICSAFMIGSAASAEALSLSRAYALSLLNEPKLKSAYYQAQAAREYENQTYSRLLPQVQGSLSWGIYDYDAQYLSKPVRETYSSYSLSASQAIYHPELFSGLDEGKARVKYAEYKYKEQAQQLGFDVVKAYFGFIREMRSVDLAYSQKEYYDLKFNQLEELLKVGMSNKIDVLEAKVRRDQAISEWMTEKKRLAVAKLRIEYFIGEKVDSISEIDFETLPLDSFRVERNAFEEKLENNPTLNASKSSGDVSRSQLAQRQYDHYPKIDLNLMRKETYTKDTVAHSYDTQAIVQMTIPIYQGGNTQSRIREAMSLVKSAAEDVDYQRKDMHLRFETSWSERSLMIEKIDVLRQSIMSAQLFVTSVEQGHAAGLKSLVDVLDAKAKLFEVKRNLIDAGFDLINNQISLMDLTGELSAESIEEFEKKILSKN